MGFSPRLCLNHIVVFFTSSRPWAPTFGVLSSAMHFFLLCQLLTGDP